MRGTSPLLLLLVVLRRMSWFAVATRLWLLVREFFLLLFYSFSNTVISMASRQHQQATDWTAAPPEEAGPGAGVPHAGRRSPEAQPH